MNDLISRSSAIFYAISGPVRYVNGERWIKINKVREGIENAPSVQPEIERKILAAGYTGKEIRLYIGGRLFAVRELPQ